MRAVKVLLIILLLAGVVIGFNQVPLYDSAVPVENLDPVQLAGHHRLIVLAPHCDDETLGSAGMILAAVRAGMEIRVVIATNGDGFFFATMQDFRKVYPTHADFIRFGEIRQKESLAALAVLGVKADQVTFLSYPDRGTPALWNNNWDAANPYRSPYSGDSKSPYPVTFNPGSNYSGADFLADVTSILETYRPDLVVYPHPQDVHPDHWGLNVFTRLALTQIQHRDPAYQPDELTYLVHRPDFPEVKGLKPGESLTPPAILYSQDPQWYRFDLSSADEKLKNQAIQEYKSQLPLLHSLMDSFVRTNEIFAPVKNGSLANIVEGNATDPSTWKDQNGASIPPAILDPAGDFTTRQILPAGDLIAIYAAKDKTGNLHLCSQVRENSIPEILYILRLKALEKEGITSYQARSGSASTGWSQVTRSGPYACAVVSLSELGNPWAVFIGATTQSIRRVEDESAWQMEFIGQP